MSLALSPSGARANCFLLFGHTHVPVTAALLHRMASLPKFSKVCYHR